MEVSNSNAFFIIFFKYCLKLKKVFSYILQINKINTYDILNSSFKICKCTGGLLSLPLWEKHFLIIKQIRHYHLRFIYLLPNFTLMFKRCSGLKLQLFLLFFIIYICMSPLVHEMCRPCTCALYIIFFRN